MELTEKITAAAEYICSKTSLQPTIGLVLGSGLGDFADTLEDAVRKMTSLPARQFPIAERGELREGYYADVLVFDPETIGDVATYDDPARYSVGMDTVIVNGQIVYQDQKLIH